MTQPPSLSPPSRLSIRRKVVIGSAFVFAMLGIITYITWKSTRAYQWNAEQITQSRELLENGEQLMRHIMELESARRGFLINGDSRARHEHQQARAEIADSFQRLKEMTVESPAQSVRIDRLRGLIMRLIAIHEKEAEARRTGGEKAAPALFAQPQVEAVMRELREVMFAFEHTERVELAESASGTELIGQTTTMVTLIGTSLTFLALSSAVVLILRDIRRRQRAEMALAEQANLLTSIMDAMPDHLYVKDTEGRYILYNRAYRVYLALRAGETIEGKTVFDLFPRALAERYHKDDLFVLETGAPLRHREEPARPTSRNITWLATTKMPLRDPGGRVIGVVCVSTDITARKEADEKLKQFAEQLERSNAELNSFASVASHDLQEPLRKIQAFGDRLRTKCGEQLGEQGRDYLERMQKAAERMQVLIQDLLKLSRVASRAQPFERCALGQVMAGVLGDLEVAIEEKQAQVIVGELPEIDADPLQMRQLFQNLITNALKFQKPGEAPVVTISSEVYEAVGGELPLVKAGSKLCRIAVQDNGIGFDPKFTDQIFVVFQRLHTRQEFAGTGIGLAVCRKITDRHGGTILAESAEGQGATFIVTLPVHQPQPPAHEKRDHADHNPDGR